MKSKVLILVAILILPLHSQDNPDLEFNDVENRFASKSVDRALKVVGKSTAIGWFARQIRKQLSAVKDESEKDTCLKFFKIAQNDLRIPEQNQLAVQYFNFEKREDGTTYAEDGTTYARVHENSILVNKLLLNRTIGQVRQTAYHEAMHHLYNDGLTEYLPSGVIYGSFIVSLFMAYKLLDLVDKGTRTSKDLAMPAAGFILSMAINIISKILEIKFDRYKEQRSDIEAYKRLKCYKCIEEITTHSLNDIDFEIRLGYVATGRLQIFYDRYKQADCLCTFHKKREHEERAIFIKEISEEELKEYAQQARGA